MNPPAPAVNIPHNLLSSLVRIPDRLECWKAYIRQEGLQGIGLRRCRCFLDCSKERGPRVERVRVQEGGSGPAAGIPSWEVGLRGSVMDGSSCLACAGCPVSRVSSFRFVFVDALSRLSTCYSSVSTAPFHEVSWCLYLMALLCFQAAGNSGGPAVTHRAGDVRGKGKTCEIAWDHGGQ